MTLVVSSHPDWAAIRSIGHHPSTAFGRSIVKIPGWFVLLAVACLGGSLALQISLNLPDFVTYGLVAGVLGVAMPFAFKQDKTTVG